MKFEVIAYDKYEGVSHTAIVGDLETARVHSGVLKKYDFEVTIKIIEEKEE